MKSFGLLAALIAVVSLLGVLGSSQPAFAAVHCMRVYGVMAGVNGDTTIQYVELRMDAGGQVFTSGAQLTFYNASGASAGTFTLTSNMTNGQMGASILIGTTNFDTAWAAGTPDFVMPTNIMAPNGKVTFGVGGFNCGGTQTPYDSVAYGSAYTGAADYAPAFGSDLPTTGNQAIQIKATTFDSVQGPGGNNADYEVVSNPMPCKNAPSGSPVCGAVSGSSDTDGDGVPNGTDLCPSTPAATAVDANGCSDAQADPDADGVCSPGIPTPGGPTPACTTANDNCPNMANPSQANADADTFGDACDTEGPSPNTNGVGGANDCGDAVDNEGDTLVDLADPNCSNTDNDGDGVPDLSDNCPSTPNPGQENFDGDSQGDACDADDDDDGYQDDAEAGTPVCAGSVNDDNADDALVNDGCPAVGAAESNCADSMDNDSDGRVNDGCPQVGTFSEGAFNIGTGTLNPCDVGTTAPSPSWPNDFVSAGTPNSTDKTNILDLTSFLAPIRRLDTSPGNPNFSARWDLVPGRGLFAQWTAINDLTALLSGASGFPPMFGGVRAFGGPLCTGP